MVASIHILEHTVKNFKTMSKHIFMALALSAMFMTANAQDQQDFQNQQRQKPTITP